MTHLKLLDPDVVKMANICIESLGHGNPQVRIVDQCFDIEGNLVVILSGQFKGKPITKYYQLDPIQFEDISLWFDLEASTSRFMDTCTHNSVEFELVGAVIDVNLIRELRDLERRVIEKSRSE